MSKIRRTASVFLLASFLGSPFLMQGIAAEQRPNPPIAAGVTFFYYDDLDEAVDWYENKIGLDKVTDEGWVVIFEWTNSLRLGLVNATEGSLRPTENKGAMYSIDTADLEAWYEKLKDVDGIDLTQGIQQSTNGMIEVFSITDPGGYIIEFFRWRNHRPESRQYTKY
jgi:predicted enzyme related to lactoylglutathione lyase